jgi:hypothetical protein
MLTVLRPSVTIVGAVRLWLLDRFLKSRAAGFTDPDPSFNLAFTSSCIESNLAIITACIPALWPLARLWFPDTFTRLGISYRAGGSSASGGRSGGRSSGSRGKRSKQRDDGSQRVTTIGGSSQHYHSDGSSFVMKPVRGYGLTEIRSQTPTGSEEDMPTYNGILTTTNVQIKYDDGPLSKYGPYAKFGEENLEKGRH